LIIQYGRCQIIVEDVSNPGKHDEVVPTIGDSGEDKEDGQDDEMKEEVNWNPFGYRRLQDLPVRASFIHVACVVDDGNQPDCWRASASIGTLTCRIAHIHRTSRDRP
jgi:hypothetical protein